MPSLKQTAEELTDQLEGLVGQMRSELTNGNVDFEKLASIADDLSERADGLADTFSSVNDRLMQQLKQAKGGGSSGQSRRYGAKSESSKAGARS
jgi:capsule polysaccharide export protein KpsE/RkpR